MRQIVFVLAPNPLPWRAAITRASHVVFGCAPAPARVPSIHRHIALDFLTRLGRHCFDDFPYFPAYARFCRFSKKDFSGEVLRTFNMNLWHDYLSITHQHYPGDERTQQPPTYHVSQQEEAQHIGRAGHCVTLPLSIIRWCSSIRRREARVTSSAIASMSAGSFRRRRISISNSMI